MNTQSVGNLILSGDWRRNYKRILSVVDAAAVVWAMAGALVLRFRAQGNMEIISDAGESYVLLTVILAAVWWMMLGIWGSRDTTILGHGTEEFKRLLHSSFWLFGLVAIISYAFQLEIARGYVVLALPAGVLSLLIARWLVRALLCSQRRAGRSTSNVLLIGGRYGVEHLAKALLSEPAAGYKPVATYLPGAPSGTVPDTRLGLPNLGYAPEAQSILDAVKRLNPDAVAMSSGVSLQPHVVRELGWALADMQVKMIMAPALTAVAGPRIHTQPVAGLPLIHVSTPTLSGIPKLVKRSFDVTASLLLITALLPVFVTVAIAVRYSSPGPIFYTQERIGVRGSRFKMIKFRSMRQNADLELAGLLLQQGTHDKPLSKIDNDPRITPVGNILRKFSLDELPQLFNVLRGEMSLVGPRPQRDHEVALYDDAAHRRLYVSPGMSGLWQVSGRSNLTWEESIQLDLYYVENWSLTQDIIILLKTFKAVFKSEGAV